MKIVFATHNKNKLKEINAMLSDIELISLSDIDCFEEILETATTLEGNAILKANYITKKYGLDCFADDTGLEVTALDGKPGVYSARYAGKENNSTKNIDKLLGELENKTNRQARFRTVIAANLNGTQHLFEGTCEGNISSERLGTKGFGYDPVFIPKGSQISFAQMTLEEKGNISHRGKAIQKLVKFLTKP